MIKSNIWKDTVLKVEDDVFDYTIENDNEVIFKGRSFKRPGAEFNEIKINKLVENYLSNDIQDLLVSVYETGNISELNKEAYKVFVVKDKEGVVIEEYGFLFNWSYENEMRDLSYPINGHYMVGQLILSSVFEESADAVLNTVRIANENTVTNGCNGEYAIYYQTSYGGYSSFLFEGLCKKSDKITQYTTDKSYNNTSIDFETSRYVSEIVTEYELNTGWLTDEQAYNFAKNVVSSNRAYLHNLKDNVIFPIIITDATAPYKSYKVNGGLMSQYTLKCKASQTKIKR
jgi:hypothetical protein